MRKLLFKAHSYAALVAMLPLLIISITGSILVFKVEIDSWLRPEHMQVNAADSSQRQSLDQMMQKVLNQHPSYQLGGWEIFDDKQRSDAGYLIKKGTEQWFKIYLNQYNGELLSSPQPMDHYLTDWLLELHYTFLLHLEGEAVGFICALIMLFLGISGIIIYRRFWKKLFTLRFKAARRILFSDIHKLIGIISSPILIVIAFTGAYWNIADIIHQVEEHSGQHKHQIEQAFYNPKLSFESLRQQSHGQITSFHAGYLTIPHEPEQAITFYGEVNSSNPLNSEYASTVTFDSQTGHVLHISDIRQASLLTVFLDSFRKLHFGYFGGLFTRIIWCLLGLSPVLLAFTGLYLYWQRLGQRRQAKRSRQALRSNITQIDKA